LTFQQISDKLLTFKNVALRCELGYIQDLHRFVLTDIDIIRTHPEPKKSNQCRTIKKNLLYLLENYGTLKKVPPNIKIK
jgi:hypothetical protein